IRVGAFQTIAFHLLHLAQICQTAHQHTQALLCRRLGLPRTQLGEVGLTEVSNQLGVRLVGLDPRQLAFGMGGGLRRVDHADPVALLEQERGQCLVIDARSLHDDPDVEPRMLLQPLMQLDKTAGRVGQLAARAVLAVGLKGGDIESLFGNVDAHNGHKMNSCDENGVQDHHCIRSNLVYASSRPLAGPGYRPNLADGCGREAVLSTAQSGKPYGRYVLRLPFPYDQSGTITSWRSVVEIQGWMPFLHSPWP